MQTISITIPDEYFDAIDAFLRPQLKQTFDPATGMVTTEPMYPGGVEEFLTVQIGQLIQGIVRQRPTPAMREKLLAIKAIEQEIEQMARPSVRLSQAVKGSGAAA